MAVSSQWFPRAGHALVAGDVDWLTDSIKAALLTAAYVADLDNDRYFSDVDNEELSSGSGYTAGGKALTGKAVTYDTASNAVDLEASNVVWDNSSIAARYAVVYKDTGNPATAILLALIDFGQVASSADSDFTIDWAAEGSLRLAPI